MQDMKAFNPNDPKQLARLRASIKANRSRLKAFREHRLAAIQEYAGFHYSEDGTPDRRPVNFIKMFCNVYTRLLSAKEPKALVQTEYYELRHKAENMRLILNYLFREIGIRGTLKSTVLEALLSPMGILKVALESQGQHELLGERHDIGQPYADLVTLDDWVCDMSADRWEQVSFCGNKYRVDLEQAKADPLFKGGTAQLVATSKGLSLSADGDSGEANAKEIGDLAHEGLDDDEYRDQVELWDIYLPLEGDTGKILTIPVYGQGYCAYRDWYGPESGPYHTLWFAEVPGNLMAVPPIGDVFDLNDIANRMFNKIARQAERQKTILMYQASGAKDADTIIKARDGEAHKSDNPDRAREYTFGGPDQKSIAFFLILKDLFSYMGSNVDALAGLATQAETVGQERIIQQSNNTMTAEMIDRMTDFVTRVVNALAWYVFHDPLLQARVLKTEPFFGMSVPVTVTAEDLEGDFFELNFQVEPYSMQQETPASRVQAMRGIISEFLLPLMPMAQQQGVGLDMEGLITELGKYMNMPNLDQFITFSEPTEGKPMGSPPPVTSRQKEAPSRKSTVTDVGKSKTLITNMLGVNQQPSEAARMAG